MGKALEDILVLDLGQFSDGPYCSLMLAYQGAKVIKIEPLSGELLRKQKPGGNIGKKRQKEGKC